MAVPTTLTSADSGAPALSGTDGAGYAFIKWALTGLGWTLEFDDPARFVCVVRNRAAYPGTGQYLRINDDSATYTVAASSARQTEVRALEYCNGIDDVSGQFAQGFQIKSSALSSTARSYTVVGDDRTAVFLVSHDGAEPSWNYAGDIAVLDPSDPGCFLCGFAEEAANTNTRVVSAVTGFSRNPIISTIELARRINRSATFAQSLGRLASANLGARVDGNLTANATGENGTTASPFNSAVFLTKCYFREFGKIRGFLRGLNAYLNDVEGSIATGTVINRALEWGSRPVTHYNLQNTRSSATFQSGAIGLDKGDWDDYEPWLVGAAA